MDVAAHQEKTGKRETEEERCRGISERRRAALLRSFREQNCKKIVCLRRVPEVTGPLRLPFFRYTCKVFIPIAKMEKYQDFFFLSTYLFSLNCLSPSCSFA